MNLKNFDFVSNLVGTKDWERGFIDEFYLQVPIDKDHSRKVRQVNGVLSQIIPDPIQSYSLQLLGSNPKIAKMLGLHPDEVIFLACQFFFYEHACHEKLESGVGFSRFYC